MARSLRPEVPFLFVSGTIGEDRAVESLKGGAVDFVLKDSFARLAPAIRRALDEARERAARRRAEEALRLSEERYALAARGANDGLWDWDVSAGRIYLSPRWKAMLGWGVDELSDDPEEWFHRVHAQDLPGLRARMSAHFDGHSEHFECEYRIAHRDGTWLWMLSRGLARALRRGHAAAHGRLPDGHHPSQEGRGAAACTTRCTTRSPGCPTARSSWTG